MSPGSPAYGATARSRGGPGGCAPHSQTCAAFSEEASCPETRTAPAAAAIPAAASNQALPFTCLLLVACGLLRAEHGDGFNLDKQLRPASMRLDAGGGGQRIESLLLEELGALFVENVIVAIDVAQIAAGAHDVVPRAAFAREQACDVVVGAAKLGAEVADVHALAVLVDRSGARDEQDGEAVQVNAHAARERTGLGVSVRLVEHAVIGHGALLDGCLRDGLKNFCECTHV